MGVLGQQMELIPTVPLVYRHRLSDDWHTEFVGESVEAFTGYPAQEFLSDSDQDYPIGGTLKKGTFSNTKELVKRRVSIKKSVPKVLLQNLMAPAYLSPKKHSLIQLIHPDDWDKFNQVLTTPEFTGEDNIYRLEYRIVTKDGQIRLVYDRGLKVFRHGRLVLLTGVLFDLSCAVADEALGQAERQAPVDGLKKYELRANRDLQSQEYQEHYENQEPQSILLSQTIPPCQPKPIRVATHGQEPRLSQPQSQPMFVEPSIRTVVSQLQLIQLQMERSNADLAIAHLALAAQQQRYHDLFDFAPDGYLVTDPSGIIYEANLAMAQLLQAEQAAILGESFHIFVAPLEQDAFLHHWQQLLAHPADGNTFEITLQPSHGESFAAELTVGGIRTDGQDLIGYRLLVRNISERKKVEIEMYLLNQQLQERVKQQTAALEQANQELVKLAFEDALTKIANRRRFDDHLQQEWRRMQRRSEPLTLVMCDVDHFKLYNDLYGHLLGDRCLQQVAQALQRHVGRPGDLVARYGGEEFAIILSATDALGAVNVVEKIRTYIRSLKIPNGDQMLSLSFGMATVIPNQEEMPEQLLAVADQALYFAKQAGRDRYAVRELEVIAEV
jgi:diguanylate cyclase (GGDEF)-like protein/PAS domain S-box-containing protein